MEGLHLAPCILTQIQMGSGDFINPTDYDNTANVLYACSSEDIDASPSMNYVYNRYTRITGIGTTNTASLVTISNSPTSALITHVAVSPSVSNRVYFGFDNGNIGYINNANTGTSNTINFLTATGVTGSVSCISVDPANENHILVTYSNYGVNSIWETINGGTSWTSVEGNLPDMPVRWAMFDPRNSDWAIIATELGVWSTDNINGGSTDWNPTNSGLANVRVDMLQYRASDRTIAAATHGRGLFTAVVPISTTPDISFASSSAAATELTTSTIGCRSYTDYSINMQIANAPTGDANCYSSSSLQYQEVAQLLRVSIMILQQMEILLHQAMRLCLQMDQLPQKQLAFVFMMMRK